MLFPRRLPGAPCFCSAGRYVFVVRARSEELAAAFGAAAAQPSRSAAAQNSPTAAAEQKITQTNRPRLIPIRFPSTPPSRRASGSHQRRRRDELPVPIDNAAETSVAEPILPPRQRRARVRAIRGGCKFQLSLHRDSRYFFVYPLISSQVNSKCSPSFDFDKY
jgi:hypothetical protein